MPEKRVVEKAKKDLREGKSASTAAGEFVREEIHHVREGKRGARSPQQAVAIGLSEARRAGVPLKPPTQGKTSEATRTKAEHDYEKGQHEPQTQESSSPRSHARSRALKRESKHTESHSALSRHAKTAARRRRGRRASGIGADSSQMSAFNISGPAPSAKGAKRSGQR